MNKSKQCNRLKKSFACTIFGVILSVIVLVFNLTIQSVKWENGSLQVMKELSSENSKHTFFNDNTPLAKAKTIMTASNENDGPLESLLIARDGHTKQNVAEALVYRKRRYLQFPEGSSFQLVFDILLPVRDYTNYAILGITCALAFELPSKPLSELEEDLLQKLHGGGYGHHQTHEISRNGSSQDSDYVDAQHHSQKQRIKDKFSDVIYVHPSEYEHTFNEKTSNYQNDIFGYKKNTKYILGPSNYVHPHKKPTYYTNSNPNSHIHWKKTKNGKFDAGNAYDSPWLSGYLNSPNLRRHDNFPKRKQHAVYHIMGKRSIQGSSSPSQVSTITQDSKYWLDKLDRIHLQYHRSSRHAFYSKIEAMFNRQGKNGTECVLRALCETGQRKHETKPRGLVTEVLRTVFTLPEVDTETRNRNYPPIHRARDEAHSSKQNCSEEYPLCENFIWKWEHDPNMKSV